MYLGLDLGTSGLRAILCDGQGRVLASAQASYPTEQPQPGWSEQDPQHWITACEETVSQLRRSHPDAVSDLRGIGLSGHMHGAVLVGADGQPLRPCILWNDTRSAAEAERLDSHPDMRRVTGNIVFPGFTAPKLLWIERHEPEVFSKICKVLLPKDYLRLWLTGVYVSDMSDSAGTAWLDVGGRRWSPRALELGHMRADQMPDLVEGSQPAGQLRDELRRGWGISGPVVVAGGGGDNAAAACGAGCLDEGAGFVSLGTSGVVLAAKAAYVPKPETAVHTFCHAVPNRWYQMGVSLSATDSLNWLSRILGQPPAQLAGRMPDEIAGPGPVSFLPYLSGERTPHNDAAVRGAFMGLDIASGPDDLTRAVMEGVAFALADCLVSLKQTGTRLTQVITLGGGAQSRFWVKTLASVLDLPLSIPAEGEFGAALGAVRLARMACEDADVSDVMTLPRIREVITPDPKLVPVYASALAQFRASYPALQQYERSAVAE